MISNVKIIIIFFPGDLDEGQNGTKHDIVNRIKIFNELGFKVHLIVFDRNASEQLRKNDFGAEVLVIPRVISRSEYYRSSGLDNQSVMGVVSAEIVKNNPDILWFEYVNFANLAAILKKQFPDKKIFFRSHNYEIGHAWEKNLYNFKKSIFSLQTVASMLKDFFFIYKLENKMFAVANKIYCISRLDFKKYSRRFGVEKIDYLPFFSDYASLYKYKQNKSILDVVYLGSDFINNVNLSGVLLINKIAAKLKNSSVVFHILGKSLNKKILLAKNVVYHDYVEDLDSFFDDMDVGIVPVEIGFGMKVKAYEFLKRGFPTIISKRCSDVFGGVPSSDYLVAGNINEWVKCIIFLKDDMARKKMSEHALFFMNTEFSKEKIAATLSSCQ